MTMMHRFQSAAVATAIGAGALTATPQEVEAALKRITGDIQVFNLSSGFNGSDVSVGTFGHYDITVDTSVTDSLSDDPEHGRYLNSVLASNISLGSVVFSSNSMNPGKVDVVNSPTVDAIAMSILTPSLEAGNINGATVNFIQVGFIEFGDDPSALNNAHLSDAFHEACLAQLTSRQIDFVTSNGPINARILNYQITDVPSSGVVVIVLPAMAMLAVLRRRPVAPGLEA